MTLLDGLLEVYGNVVAAEHEAAYEEAYADECIEEAISAVNVAMVNEQEAQKRFDGWTGRVTSKMYRDLLQDLQRKQHDLAMARGQLQHLQERHPAAADRAEHRVEG